MNGYNFTERVRKCLLFAREEAVRLRHQYIGTEHILLGVLTEGESIAITILENLGADLNDIRAMVESTVKLGTSREPMAPFPPYTSRAKKVLDLAMEKARSMGHSYVGTEHLLLGLLAEEKGIASQVLFGVGITLEAARAETLKLLGEPAAAGEHHNTFIQGQPSRVQQSGSAVGYNFTERVRKCLALARDEAARLRYEYVGTEHLLLGILVEGEGVAATVLQNLGAGLDEMRDLVERTAEPGKSANRTGPHLPYARRAKKVLELAMAEARGARHNYVGTEHLLLGLLREEGGLGGQILKTSRVTLENARTEIHRVLGAEMPADANVVPMREVPRPPALRRVTPRLREILNEACRYAPRINAETPVMIAVALLRHAEGAMRALLDHLQLNIPLLLERLEPIMAAEVAATEGANLAQRAESLRQLFLFANAEANRTHDQQCSSGHMLVALVATNPAVATAFLEQGFGADEVRSEFARLSG